MLSSDDKKDVSFIACISNRAPTHGKRSLSQLISVICKCSPHVFTQIPAFMDQVSNATSPTLRWFSNTWQASHFRDKKKLWGIIYEYLLDHPNREYSQFISIVLYHILNLKQLDETDNAYFGLINLEINQYLFVETLLSRCQHLITLKANELKRLFAHITDDSLNKIFYSTNGTPAHCLSLLMFLSTTKMRPDVYLAELWKIIGPRFSAQTFSKKRVQRRLLMIFTETGPGRAFLRSNWGIIRQLTTPPSGYAWKSKASSYAELANVTSDSEYFAGTIPPATPQDLAQMRFSFFPTASARPPEEDVKAISPAKRS